MLTIISLCVYSVNLCKVCNNNEACVRFHLMGKRISLSVLTLSFQLGVCNSSLLCNFSSKKVGSKIFLITRICQLGYCLKQYMIQIFKLLCLVKMKDHLRITVTLPYGSVFGSWLIALVLIIFVASCSDEEVKQNNVKLHKRNAAKGKRSMDGHKWTRLKRIAFGKS